MICKRRVCLVKAQFQHGTTVLHLTIIDSRNEDSKCEETCFETKIIFKKTKYPNFLDFDDYELTLYHVNYKRIHTGT